MQFVGALCGLLENHADRDKVVALTSYVLKLWGATNHRPTLLAASARLTSARATLRLFDDCAAFRNTLAYGLGKKEGQFWGSLGVAGNTSTILYLQLEKIVFLLDCGLFQVNKDLEHKLRAFHKVFWSLSAAISFVRSVRGVHISATELKSPSPRKCAPARFTQSCLITTKFLFDVIHAVSWLPEGWLWGGKLSAGQAGGVATVSGVVALVMYYNGKRLETKR